MEALDEVTTEENVGSTEYPEEENRVGTSDRPGEWLHFRQFYNEFCWEIK